jgi:hypothetical protein
MGRGVIPRGEVSDREFVKLRKAAEEYRESVTRYTEKNDDL